MKSKLGTVLLALCALAVVSIYAPSPTFSLWVLHFAAVELAPVVAVTASISAALLLGATVRRRLAIGVVILSVVQPLPLLIAAHRADVDLSLRDWAFVGAGGAAGTPTETDVPLSPGLLADLYRPAGSGPHPAVLVIHGGSWRAGDKGEVQDFSAALASRGFLVADLRYRLAPEHPFPAAVADVKCALGRLRERPEVTPDRIFLLGRSAGGHLALLAGFDAASKTISPACEVKDVAPAGIIALYSFTDPALAHAHPPLFDPVDNVGATEDFLGKDLRSSVFTTASVAAHLSVNSPPVLLIYGQRDRLVRPEHSTSLADLLQASGRPVTAVGLPATDHAFDHRSGGLAAQVAASYIFGFLEGRLPH